jgi:archaellum component FlaC
MFSYSDDLDKFLNSRRQTVIDKNNESISSIRSLINTSLCCQISKFLTIKYIDACERCLDEIYGNTKSTITLVANLRFLFETCINTRLLNKKASYKYKVYYAIHESQLKKSESLIRYIQVDLTRLDKLELEEVKFQPSTTSNLEEIKENLANIEKLYNEIDEEISLFLDALPLNGIGFQRHHIQKYLAQTEARRNEISNEWEETKKTLIKDEDFNSYFDCKHQVSKIEKELRDSRNWKEKAAAVDLSELYSFIYDYTSSLIHSNSYSIITSNQLDSSEAIMIRSLSNRLASDILKQLKIFASIPNFKVINLDD